MGASLEKNCYRMHGLSIIETPRNSNKNLIISEHYSKYICSLEDSAKKKTKKKRRNFKLTENIEKSRIMMRRGTLKTIY